MFYTHPDIRYPISTQWPGWQILLAALALGTISAFAVMRLKQRPWLATGWFWYLGTLVPVIGIVQVGAGDGRPLQLHSVDRSLHLRGLGVMAPLERRLLGRPALAAGGLAVLVLCTALTRTQAGSWRTNLTLFEHALALDANNPVAHYQVGCALAIARKHEAALVHFRRAVQEDPTYADAYCALATSLKTLGNLKEAAAVCRTALEVRPCWLLLNTCLAMVLWIQGEHREAVEHYKEALRLDPECAEAQQGMGMALTRGQELRRRSQLLRRYRPSETQGTRATRRSGHRSGRRRQIRRRRGGVP